MSSSEEPTRPAFPHRDVFLGVGLFLLAANVAILVSDGDYRSHKYMNIVVVLMLVFNHIAFQYRLPGVYGTTMKSVAWIWTCCGTLYIGSVLFLRYYMQS